MNRREQPYGIEWWIDLLFQAVDRQEQCIKLFNRTGDIYYGKRRRRYSDLGNWIHSRISDKYGEEEMNVQTYINEKYEKHCQESKEGLVKFMHPDEFLHNFNPVELGCEPWYFEPIYDLLEDEFYEEYGDEYGDILGEMIDWLAKIDLFLVDQNEMIDRLNGERR